ncbi:uncharacterized protein [Branchiostoma lanceolatum]|uniref:uncharacterized protein n=1 Tax=Branchiostoma lanceolatum TaxID=7740 RepID=UPI003452E926
MSDFEARSQELTRGRFAEDFIFLAEMKDFVLSQVNSAGAEELPEITDAMKGTFYELSDGRKIQCFFPNGKRRLQECSSKEWLFVGFLGRKLPYEDIPTEVESLVWEKNTGLIAQLQTHRDILAYCSAEREAGGDWGNIIFMASQGALLHWRQLELHGDTVRDLSPRYYRDIRIHCGLLRHGERGDCFLHQRTIFLDYGDFSTTGKINRIEKYWETDTTEPEQPENA